MPSAMSRTAVMRRCEGSSRRAMKSATIVMMGVNACGSYAEMSTQANISIWYTSAHSQTLLLLSAALLMSKENGGTHMYGAHEHNESKIICCQKHHQLDQILQSHSIGAVRLHAQQEIAETAQARRGLAGPSSMLTASDSTAAPRWEPGRKVPHTVMPCAVAVSRLLS